MLYSTSTSTTLLEQSLRSFEKNPFRWIVRSRTYLQKARALLHICMFLLLSIKHIDFSTVSLATLRPITFSVSCSLWKIWQNRILPSPHPRGCGASPTGNP